MLIFGLYGGVIVDRFSKRKLLMITQRIFATALRRDSRSSP